MLNALIAAIEGAETRTSIGLTFTEMSLDSLRLKLRSFRHVRERKFVRALGGDVVIRVPGP